jgi:hypothetical protein
MRSFAALRAPLILFALLFKIFTSFLPIFIHTNKQTPWRESAGGKYTDRGLVVRVPGYRSRGPGSIPGTTRFSEK